MNKNKVKVVKEIEEKIKDSKSITIAEYTGSTVKKIQELKKKLKESKAILKVYKNRLFKIAANNLKKEKFGEFLTGQNAFIFGNGDEIAILKILKNYSKETKNLKLKAGTFEGKILGTEKINEIALLPSFDESLQILALSLSAPLRYLAVGLKMVSENK